MCSRAWQTMDQPRHASVSGLSRLGGANHSATANEYCRSSSTGARYKGAEHWPAKTRANPMMNDDVRAWPISEGAARERRWRRGWRSSLWRARASSYRCCARARLVITMLHKHAPCDAGQLVSQSCSQRIIVQPLSRSGKPRSKAVLHPIPWPKQNDTGRLQEEHTKVAIAAFGDAPGNRSITCGYLLGYQAEPSSKIAATCEGSPITDRGDDGA
jgi:hypothetical protein